MARNDASPASVDFTDLAYRWSDYDTPLWVRPNSTAQRWNRAREQSTQYLSLSPEAAWAELIRAEDLTSEAEVRLVRMPMWVLRVHETHLADYGTFEKAEAAGFPAEALVEDDHERCRVEAIRLRELGFRGVLAPSAALPGAVNLTLFGARLAVEWDCVDDGRLSSFVPAKQLAVGHPPEDLLPHVRQHGATHNGLHAFRAA